jgi:hypothetical protein
MRKIGRFDFKISVSEFGKKSDRILIGNPAYGTKETS